MNAVDGIHDSSRVSVNDSTGVAWQPLTRIMLESDTDHGGFAIIWPLVMLLVYVVVGLVLLI